MRFERDVNGIHRDETLQTLNLVIDIGNSFYKLAVIDKGAVLHYSRQKKVLVHDIRAIYSKYPFTRVAMASVRRSHPGFIHHLKKNYHLLIVDHDTPVPVKILYETPETLGLDRLCGVVGANVLHPSQNALVIDIGTCMTMDFIDAQGQYHGGNISPGVDLRLRAMHAFTSQLPLAERKLSRNLLLGKTTEQALQNGAIMGLRYEIMGFIKTLTEKYGHADVILTGGDAEYFGEFIDSRIFVRPNLVLIGLNEVLEYNS